MREQDLTGHLQAMSDAELEATRRDLVTGLGFMTPANGMHAPASTFLDAVTSELAQRERQASTHPRECPAATWQVRGTHARKTAAPTDRASWKR